MIVPNPSLTDLLEKNAKLKGDLRMIALIFLVWVCLSLWLFSTLCG